jgi:hypothetical protein
MLICVFAFSNCNILCVALDGEPKMECVSLDSNRARNKAMISTDVEG